MVLSIGWLNAEPRDKTIQSRERCLIHTRIVRNLIATKGVIRLKDDLYFPYISSISRIYSLYHYHKGIGTLRRFVALDSRAKMTTPYAKAFEQIDLAHAQDPKKITINGQETPYELHYATKCTKYLTLHDANASELLRLAVRAQHLRRWEMARSSYPLGRPGYFAWRTAQKNKQAEHVQEICVQCGYSVGDAERVASLVRKENMTSDAECQVLEDVACLVFLDDQFEEFEKEHDEEKIVRILQKTWAKMSARGHELALAIPMSERAKGLVVKALES